MPDHHLTCQEIVELVTDYLEYALDSETAAQFEEHINFCDGCAAYLGQMRAAIETVGSDRARGRPGGDARRAARRVPGVEADVIGYKFLRADGSTVFSGSAGRCPGTSPARGWRRRSIRAAAASTPAARAICPTGSAETLYEIELDGEIVEERTR